MRKLFGLLLKKWGSNKIFADYTESDRLFLFSSSQVPCKCEKNKKTKRNIVQNLHDLSDIYAGLICKMGASLLCKITLQQ